PQRPPSALGPQLAHLRITGTANFRAVRETEGRTEFHEMPDAVRHVVLLFLGEGIPPISEFIGELDFPRHAYSMPYTEYFLRRRRYATDLRFTSRRRAEGETDLRIPMAV